MGAETFWIGGVTEWGPNPASGVRVLSLEEDSVGVSKAVDVGANPMFVADYDALPVVVSQEVPGGYLSALPPAGSPDHRDIALPPGSGPRHLVVSGTTALVACELSGMIQAVDIVTGELGFSTPATQGSGTLNFPSTIRLTSNGHVLVGNRGPDTIGVFKWHEDTGVLEHICEVSCGGEHPRDLQLTVAEDALVVANLLGSNIAIFDFDNATGDLRFRQSLPTNQPACVVRRVSR